MFLISWKTALFTLTAMLALYSVVAYRKPDVNWGSSTQAQTYNSALASVHQLSRVEEHVKNYRPQVLVFSGFPSSRPSLVDFAHLITKKLSLLTCGNIIKVPLSQKTRTTLAGKAHSWLVSRKMKAFYTHIDGCTFQEGGQALMAACGLGKLKPNIVLLGYKSDWHICDHSDLNMYFNVLHKALDLYVAITILRVQEGHDISKVSGDESDNYEFRRASAPKFSSTPIKQYALQKERSSSESSQGSSSSEESSSSSLSTPKFRLPNDKEMKISWHMVVDESKLSKNKISSLPQFQKRQRKGTIDVWWIYDDGGLTLLLPYIISTRKSWSDCKLRVFTIANKKDELQFEQRTMAALLAKFRIDYSELKVISDITREPQEETKAYFEELIKHLKVDDEEQETISISEAELLGMKDKTNRHLRLRELLLEHSTDANLIVMTMPMPRRNIVSASLYLAWLEVLSRDMPPFLLVRGNQQSVLTFYS